MKERPILFSAPMVRALLDGSKTQTRRPVNAKRTNYQSIEEREDGTLWPWREDLDNACDYWYPSPYGKAGDRLWVKETWRTVEGADPLPPSLLTPAYRFWYEADAPHQPGFGKTRPSIFMPRIASRINLEITGVRVERLQDISEIDAAAEGVDHYEPSHTAGLPPCSAHRYAYEDLWREINGPGSWDANPWVWVVEFKRDLDRKEGQS